MPTLTTAQTGPRYFFDEPFDELLNGPSDGPLEAPRNDRADDSLHRTPLSALDELLAAEPAPARASLATVIGLFLALALLQVGMSALIVTTFDLTGVRLALVYVIAAPALLYGVIAAWDHRQLRASGHPNPTPWGWALLSPPVYLILRWATASTGGRDRMRNVFGWALAQAVVSLSLVLLIGVGIVASAAPAADAAGVADAPIATVSVDDTATLLTGDGIENAVVAIWKDSGDTGTVSCPDGFSTSPGTTVTCQGVLEGQGLSFTIIVNEPVAGAMPWGFTSWTPSV